MLVSWLDKACVSSNSTTVKHYETVEDRKEQDRNIEKITHS
jgi:hypothetical protein